MDNQTRKGLVVFCFAAAGILALVGIWRLMDCLHFGSEVACFWVLMRWEIPVGIFAVGAFYFLGKRQ